MTLSKQGMRDQGLAVVPEEWDTPEVLSHTHSLSLSLYRSLPLCLPVSPSLPASLCLPLSRSLARLLPLSLNPSLSHSLSLSLPISLLLPLLCLSTPLSLSPSLSHTRW